MILVLCDQERPVYIRDHQRKYLVRSKRHLNKIKNSAEQDFFQPKTFDQDQKINRMNDRLLFADTQRFQESHKISCNCYGFGIGSYEKHVMLPYFFPQ